MWNNSQWKAEASASDFKQIWSLDRRSSIGGHLEWILYGLWMGHARLIGKILNGVDIMKKKSAKKATKKTTKKQYKK